MSEIGREELKKPVIELDLNRPIRLSLADLAYAALLKAIVNQAFMPGELLNVDSLANQLQMSKTPVREALMRLTGERLVVQTNNRGFIVSALLTEADFHYLFETRQILELNLLQSVKIDQAVLSRLRADVNKMSKMEPGTTYERYAEFTWTDHEFHRGLLGMSANPFLFEAWEDLHFHLHIARLYIGIGIFDHVEAAKEHDEILTALEAGEQERAVTLLASHIRGAEKRLTALFEYRR